MMNEINNTNLEELIFEIRSSFANLTERLERLNDKLRESTKIARDIEYRLDSQDYRRN